MLGRRHQQLLHLRRGLDSASRDLAVSALDSLPPPSPSPSPSPLKKRGRAVDREKLWRKFFSDPSHWSDVRAHKISSKQPDWIHMKTKERLWVKSASTPSWVRKKLASIPQYQASPPQTKTDHSLQESVTTIQSMEIQTRTNQCDNSTPGTSYSPTGPHISDSEIRDICLTGKPRNALHIFSQRGVTPTGYAYVCLLRRSATLQDIGEGKYVHAHMTKTRFMSTTFVLNALLNMYTKCGSLPDARELFDTIQEKDKFTWSVMLGGYAKLGHPHQAYKLYEQMWRERVPLDRVTFTTILSVCAALGSLEKGLKVHSDIIHSGIHPDRMLSNTLIDMYAKCGDLTQAHQVFKDAPERDIVTWNVMISGAAQNGFSDVALALFHSMRDAGLKPDKVTYVSVLNACGSLEQGRALYSDIVLAGFARDARVGTALVNMFSKCGSLQDAVEVFQRLPHRNVFSWTSVIAAFAQSGAPQKAWEFYEKMLMEGEVVPDKVTYTTVLRVCADLGDLKKGKEVHEEVIKSGTPSDLIMESTLVDMYVKCGRVDFAHDLVRNMNPRDVISYTSVIGGYVNQSRFREALDVFHSMQREGVLPNTGTFLGVVKACAGLRAGGEGTRIHGSIVEAGLGAAANLRCALDEMYAQCDAAQEASGL